MSCFCETMDTILFFQYFKIGENMKIIDQNNWKRKKHYEFFKKMEYPFFNICGKIDVTTLLNYCRKMNFSFYHTMIYAATKAANLIEEFKMRIRGETIVVHEIVHPSFTILVEKEVFDFCYVKYVDNFNEFLKNAEQDKKMKNNKAELKDEIGKDDLLYISSIPWIEFTSISHPIKINNCDSIPRITWGKYEDYSGKKLIPFSVQVNHALMDGVHVGKYFKMIQEIAYSIDK